MHAKAEDERLARQARRARRRAPSTRQGFGPAGRSVTAIPAWTQVHEPGTRLADLVAAGTARVLGVPVRFERGRWFAAFTVEQDVSHPSPAGPGAVAGIDLGIKTLAVLSTGQQIPNPRHLGRSLRKVRRLSRTMSRRRGPDRRTRQPPSNRWRRAAAALGKVQGRVADQRRDALHKATTDLTGRFGTLVIEDLNVHGCSPAGGWPATSRMPRSPSSGGSWSTRRPGGAAG